MQERQVVAIPGLGSSTLTGEDTPEIDTVQFLRRSKPVFVGLSLMYVCVYVEMVLLSYPWYSVCEFVDVT